MSKKTEKNTDDEEQVEGAKGGLGMVGTIILGVAAIAGSFGASFLFASPPPPAPTEMAACEPVEQIKAEAPKPGLINPDQYFVQMDEIIVTVGSEPASRFLKMNATIVTNTENAEITKTAQPLLADAFINYLRSVELSDFEDPAFYPRIREQLSRRAELVLGAKATQGVLITEFLLR